MEQAGTQTIPQKEWGVFVQDTWQPMPYLTINLGLRWEAQLEPDPITPPNEVFFAGFIGTTKTDRPSPRTEPSRRTRTCGSRAWASPRTRRRTARPSFAPTSGSTTLESPGLNLASTRSTNGSRSARRSTAVSSAPRRLPRRLPHPFRFRDPGKPRPPERLRSTRTSRTRGPCLAPPVEREVLPDLAAHDPSTTTRNDAPDPLRQPQRRGAGASRLVHRPRGDGTNGVGERLTTVESSAKSHYWGITLGVNKRFSDCFGVQLNYTYSKDRSDDDNERDPFTLRYARIHEDPNDPTSEFSQEYSWSDRDQRHRLNALDDLGRAPRDQLQRPVLVSVRPAPGRHGGRVARRLLPVPLQSGLRSPASLTLRHAAQPRAQEQPVQCSRPATLPGLYLRVV